MNKALIFIVFFVTALVGSGCIFSSPQAYAQGIQASRSAAAIPNVPFFSQFKNIQSPEWQQVGCGITSLAMMIDFYKPGAVSVDALLEQGITAGAYDANDGWIFGGLIQLSQKYGLTGSYHDLSTLSAKTALARFENFLKSGPLILSVHNKFNPKSAVIHLIVIDGIKNNFVYYNDPAAKAGKKKISVANLLRAWKKKIIVFRPTGSTAASLPSPSNG